MKTLEELNAILTEFYNNSEDQTQLDIAVQLKRIADALEESNRPKPDYFW